MMRRILVILLATAAPVAALAGPVAPRDAVTFGPARLPGFAAALSDRPVITGPAAWVRIDDVQSWAAIAGARPDARQASRWDYARSLIARGRGNDAVGVLDVMVADDTDLALTPSWQLARGAALAGSGRGRDALAALAHPALAANPEACLWRMLALADAGLAARALSQVGCAQPALTARPKAERTRFVLAASHAALGEHPALTLKWLEMIPDDDPAANLLRGKAHLALGAAQAGRLRLERVGLRGTPEQRVDAQLSMLEAAPTPSSAKALDRIRFTWRGGGLEERALRLGLRLAERAHEPRRAMAASATLLRYFQIGPDAAPMMAGVHARLADALRVGSATPIAEAAGMYWDYRDLAPVGAEGDRLVGRLADRLAAEGLYARAAELLQYRLTARMEDIAQGPASVKVATLHILAGFPDRALAALRATDHIAYPADMLSDRRRVGAAALHLMGHTAEALSVLQDVPGSDRYAAEIRWRTRDWAGLVDADAPPVPGAGPLNEIEQTIVLRHAIALAMLGREDRLAALRARYAAGFAGSPSSPTFDVLTRTVGSIDAAGLSQAMAALPSASPAGAFGDLLDADVVGARAGA